MRPTTMRELPAKLLDRPSPEVVRLFVLVRVHDLLVARDRLDDPEDTESLHDFRVALRRLRSLLRSYRELLTDSVPGKLRRRLSGMATASGTSRDSEVRLQWLSHNGQLHPDDPGQEFITRTLERDRRKGDRELQRALERDFTATTEDLQRRLQHYRVTYALDDPTALRPAREVISRTIRAMAATLEELLAAPHAMGDTNSLHRARVTAKRLRYTLEPLVEGDFAAAPVRRAAKAAIAQLKVLQDELGDLHDALTCDRWLADRIAEEAARLTRALDVADVVAPPAGQPEEQPANPASMERVVTLRRQLHAQAARHHGVLDSARRRQRTERLISRVHVLADRLMPRSSRATPPPTEAGN